jgi:hypothetical protein
MHGSGRDPFYSQRGNALFLVLVAIALFAALAYVVMQAGGQSQRGGQGRDLTTLSRVTTFPIAIQTAVRRMVQSGAKLTDLDFTPGADGKTAVFSPKAGGIAYRTPSPAGTVEWAFKTVTADDTGWFVAGMGTDGAEGKDVFAYLEGVSLEACAEINGLLGLDREPLKEEPPVILTGTGGDSAAKAGKNAWTFKIQNEGPLLMPQPAACVQNGEKYVYYHVIVAR